MKAKKMLLQNADEMIENIKSSIGKIKPKVNELEAQLSEWERLKKILLNAPDDLGAPDEGE